MTSSMTNNEMIVPMRYESFLGWAFGLGFKNGESMAQLEDPANMINTNQFSEDNLTKIKCAVGYAITIFSSNILNFSTKNQAGINETIDTFLERLIKAENLGEIDQIIKDFEETIVDKFYNRQDGKISLKND